MNDSSASTATASPPREKTLRTVPPVRPAGNPTGASDLPGVAPTRVPFRIQVAEFLRARGVGARALVTFALILSATAAFVFVLRHPGLGGVLGLVALLAAELSLVRLVPESRESADLVRCLNPLVDLLLAAGILGGVVGMAPPAVVVLALLVMVLMAWLPLVKARAGATRIPQTAGLWPRADRMAILLVGTTLGRLGPALFVLATVMAIDAWLRFGRLELPPGLHPQYESRVAKELLRPDGSLVPMVRWTTLGLTLLALVLLPPSTYWRF